MSVSAHFIFVACKIHITVHAVLTQVKCDFSVRLVQMNATELEEYVLKEKNFWMNTSSCKDCIKDYSWSVM